MFIAENHRKNYRGITTIKPITLPLSKICTRHSFGRYGFTSEGCESTPSLDGLVYQRDFPDFIKISFKTDKDFLFIRIENHGASGWVNFGHTLGLFQNFHSLFSIKGLEVSSDVSVSDLVPALFLYPLHLHEYRNKPYNRTVPVNRGLMVVFLGHDMNICGFISSMLLLEFFFNQGSNENLTYFSLTSVRRTYHIDVIQAPLKFFPAGNIYWPYA